MTSIFLFSEVPTVYGPSWVRSVREELSPRSSCKYLGIVGICNSLVWVRMCIIAVGRVAHELPILKFYLDKFSSLVLPLATLAVV